MQNIKLAVLVGNNIALRRKAFGFTQKELAQKLDITSDAMMKIERGSIAPKMSRLQEIADILQCPVSYLFIDSTTANVHEIALLLAEKFQGLSNEQTQHLIQQIDLSISVLKK